MNPIGVVRSVTGWTQRMLAHHAGTSQPTIAAYESGAKSPTWRTIERIARGADIAVYPYVGQPMTRDQARSLALHQAIAKELLNDPEAVVARARRNLDRMARVNPRAHPLLREWAATLERSPRQIASLMLDPSEHGRDLRQVTPFAGVLPTHRRTQVYRAFQQSG